MNRNSDLPFLQSLPEPELTELVIMPLLEKLGYSEIRNTHGSDELGKDVVFCREDPLSGPRYQAAAIKCKALSGSASGSDSAVTLINQLRQALTEPYILPSTGVETRIQSVYFITPFPAGPTVAKSIRTQLLDLWSRVEIIDGPRLFDLVTEHLPDLLLSLGNPETKYQYQLVIRFRSYSAIGNSGLAARYRVHDLFIPPSIVPVTLEDARLISFASPNEKQGKAIPYTDWIKSTRNAVVLADVGSGKTTLMQRLVLDSFESVAEQRLNGLLPLYVPLSRLTPNDCSSASIIMDRIALYLGDEYQLPFRCWQDLTEHKSRPLLVLLDGYDELAGDHSVMTAALQNIPVTPHLRVLVTSRPSRIPEVTNFELFRLCLLSDEDIHIFLSKWFRDRLNFADVLAERILTSSTLQVVCRTPLMLTLYALLATTQQNSIDQLPTRKTEIYTKVVEFLLARWDLIRGISSVVSSDAKAQILEALAFGMHERQKRVVPKGDLMAHSERVMMSRLERSYKQSDAIAAVDELLYRSSLVRFADGERTKLEFTHLSCNCSGPGV